MKQYYELGQDDVKVFFLYQLLEDYITKVKINYLFDMLCA